MIKQRIINRTILGLFLMFTFSCRDVLEIEPISSIGVSSFWQSPDDASGALAGAYTELRELYTGGGEKPYFAMGSLRSGNYEHAPIRNPIGFLEYFENRITAGNATLGWEGYYKVISSVNLILAKVPDMEFPNESQKNEILAEAYTMRAYVYFILARSWGDVPLITEPLSNFDAENTQVEREPVQQIFDLIKADLESALELYPDNELSPNRVTWSRPAANMLKGEVYLWTGKLMDGGSQDFTTALAAFEEVENADVQLLEDYSEVFDYDNKGNQEIIFAIHYDELEGGNNFYFNAYSQDQVILLGDEEAERRLMPGGWGVIAPAAHLRNQFNDEDQRKDATFYEIYDEDGSYITSSLVKYNGTVIGTTRRFIDDVIIYRYGNLLLLKAEAKNALGQDPSTEINMIRERAYGENFDQHIFVSGSQEENDEAILQERLFELGWEGTRFWDLVRFGKAYELAPSLQGRENEVPLLMPVDQETLTRNPNLTQTPGW